MSDKITPDKQDLDAIEEEHADTLSGAEKYRLAQAHKMIRLNKVPLAMRAEILKKQEASDE